MIVHSSRQPRPFIKNFGESPELRTQRGQRAKALQLFGKRLLVGRFLFLIFFKGEKEARGGGGEENPFVVIEYGGPSVFDTCWKTKGSEIGGTTQIRDICDRTDLCDRRW